MSTNTQSKLLRDFIAIEPGARQRAVLAMVKHARRHASKERPDVRAIGHLFYPTANEERACCCVREPTAMYPLSKYHHCRTLKHCEHLVDAIHADVLVVRKALVAHGLTAYTELEVVLRACADIEDYTSNANDSL